MRANSRSNFCNIGGSDLTRDQDVRIIERPFRLPVFGNDGDISQRGRRDPVHKSEPGKPFEATADHSVSPTVGRSCIRGLGTRGSGPPSAVDYGTFGFIPANLPV